MAGLRIWRWSAMRARTACEPRSLTPRVPGDVSPRNDTRRSRRLREIWVPAGFSLLNHGRRSRRLTSSVPWTSSTGTRDFRSRTPRVPGDVSPRNDTRRGRRLTSSVPHAEACGHPWFERPHCGATISANKKARARRKATTGFLRAERVGFEPTSRMNPLLVFETSSFNRSDTSPGELNPCGRAGSGSISKTSRAVHPPVGVRSEGSGGSVHSVLIATLTAFPGVRPPPPAARDRWSAAQPQPRSSRPRSPCGRPSIRPARASRAARRPLARSRTRWA